MLETLLEQIASSLELCAAVSFEKLRQIRVPNIVDVGPLKQRYSLLVRLME